MKLHKSEYSNEKAELNKIEPSSTEYRNAAHSSHNYIQYTNIFYTTSIAITSAQLSFSNMQMEFLPQSTVASDKIPITKNIN